MLLLTILACTGETPVYENFKLYVKTLGDLETDTGDTGVIIETEPPKNNIIVFKSIGIDCETMATKTLTFTEMFPGRASLTTLDANFYAEAFRKDVSTLSLETPTDDSGTPEPDNCLISMELPTFEAGAVETDIELELQDVTLSGSDDEIDVQWSFLYPAMFSKQEVSCSLNEVQIVGNRITCETLYTVGTTSTPSRVKLDPKLTESDFYEWGSEVLLVYLDGEITGSFGDLGYETGWNLVRLDQSEISLVEPVSNLDELSEITIVRSTFQSKYHIDVIGTMENSSWPGVAFSVGSSPFKWFEYDETVEIESGYSSIISYIDNTWTFDIYDVPAAEFFLEAEDENNEYAEYYAQWKSYVPVAPFIPLAFYTEEDDTLQLNDTRIGAICNNSYSMALLYFQRPSRPSEVLWYQVMDLKPGWQAYVGTHGDPSTWFKVQESNVFGVDFNYTNLSIGPSCLLPDSWISWSGNP